MALLSTPAVIVLGLPTAAAELAQHVLFVVPLGAKDARDQDGATLLQEQPSNFGGRPWETAPETGFFVRPTVAVRAVKPAPGSAPGPSQQASPSSPGPFSFSAMAKELDKIAKETNQEVALSKAWMAVKLAPEDPWCQVRFNHE
jgi:hypothetical protein